MTSHSIGTLDQLKAVLERGRAKGYAEDYCESNPDVACVAAPIRGEHEQVVAAISISFPVTRWNDAYRNELLMQVLTAARQFSRTLGSRRA